MSYCVNCGVELTDGEKKCPLCNTPVIHPANLKAIMSESCSTFPPYERTPLQKVSKKSILELITLIFFIPTFLSVICDLTITDTFSWSSYVVFALALLYLYSVVPIIPKRANAVISLALDALGTSLFLFFINYKVQGTWFWSFAFPITLALFCILILVVCLAIYVKTNPLTLTAITLLGLGAFCLLVEFLLNITFGIRDYLIWSEYPFITFALLGVILFCINRNAPLKEKLRRKFFL